MEFHVIKAAMNKKVYKLNKKKISIETRIIQEERREKEARQKEAFRSKAAINYFGEETMKIIDDIDEDRFIAEDLYEFEGPSETFLKN